MTNDKKHRFWRFINSVIGIWILTTIVGGYGVWQFEKYIDERKRNRELKDRYQKLSLEYEGRLSQYSAWFLTITHNEETDSIVSKKKMLILSDIDDYKNDEDTTEFYRLEKFNECVTADYLRTSIKLLSASPKLSEYQFFISNNDSCKILPSFQAVFDEYASRSTIGILAEMRIISQEITPIDIYYANEENGVTSVSKENATSILNQRILDAINNFLNPDAVVPDHLFYDENKTAEEFRKKFTKSFYGFGPAALWYGDVFAG